VKTSYCCNVFKIEDLQRGLGYIAGLGYDGTEFWEKHLSLLKVDELAAQLKTIRLEVAQVCPYFDFTGSEAEWDQSIRIAETYIGHSLKLGKPLIRVFTGKVGSGEATPAQWQAGVRGLRRVCEMAAPEGIGFALETHHGSLMDTLDSTRRLLDDVHMDNLGVNYQPGPNMGPWQEWVRVLGHRMVHFHCHNYDAEGKMAYLDQGVYYNFAEFVDAVAGKGFKGYLSVEHGYHSGSVWETARHEIGHLKQIVAKHA
jgi:sugar phosphate isomerase/epimerase